MKILVGLNNKKIDDYLDYTNSFIIGVKDFSISYIDYTIEEIEKLRKEYPNIELFISLNKNIFNKDLAKLEEILKKLDTLKINGVLFYDLSILSLVKKLHLSIPLIWGQEHMTTNYNTCNYYYDKGCEYVYISSEITEDEIKEIHDKSDIKIMSFVFGYPEVSFSKRKLLTNYFLYHHEVKNKDYYLIKSDEDNKYFIKENNLGTSILYGNILNGIKPFYNLRDTISYAIMDETLVDHDIFMKCLKVYKDLQDEKIELNDANNKVGEMVDSYDTVFYYKKTIYKVKNEKKN